jgi:uncharacterized damage-inducible protein DinB
MQMPSMAASMIPEVEQEAAITRRLLDVVPSDKLGWKPHEKSMSLGELTWHIATLNGFFSELSQKPSFDLATAEKTPTPDTVSEMIAEHSRGTAKAKKILAGMTNEQALETFER